MAAPLPGRAGFLGFPGWEPSAKEWQAEDSGSKDRTLTPRTGGTADRLGGDRAWLGPLPPINPLPDSTALVHPRRFFGVCRTKSLYSSVEVAHHLCPQAEHS